MMRSLIKSRRVRSAATAAAAACLLSQACLRIPCENTVFHTASSPDQRYVATSYMIDCGAVGEYNVHVQVRAADEAFSPHGSGEVFAARGAYTATLTWTDARTLSVVLACTSASDCTAQDRERLQSSARQSERWNDVTIRYQVIETPSP